MGTTCPCENDPSSVEAVAARYYWSRLKGKDFRRDTSGGDRFNALLNYGYGILRNHGIRAVLSDLMEPFRPIIDHAVVHLPPYSSLKKPETKRLLALACARPVFEGASSVAIEFEKLASRFGLFVEGAPKFQVPAWDGTFKDADSGIELPDDE
ncbi:MAG: hypothetical protein FWG08_01880 [Propionibacteriaceae bacterium]|nr:hypothetical protein [Propionibacteriaceae bacterium]